MTNFPFIDKAVKTNIYALLAWYFLSLIVVTQDSTMNLGMILSFEIINILMIILFLRVIFFDYKNPSFTDFSLSFFTIFWFFYSTCRDYAQSGYNLKLKLFYVTIDILSILFLIDTFINFILNSNFFIFTQEKINTINLKLKIMYGVIFFLLSFNLIFLFL